MRFPPAAPATPAAPASPAISRIGRFYVTRELGRGTAGCVYLGHDPVLGRDLALKTFNSRLPPAERNKFEQQFVNEGRAASRLSHPNIVTIYDACIEGSTIYIAMEYLQGRELSKMLLQGHRFQPDEVASIIWKLADAVEHAHQNGVVHRDIKPANIFMVKDDQPKLVDFGIARAPNRVPDDPANADEPYSLFQNNLLGTPNYMSPEQATGKPVDARTDIYSLGAVMYEMLVGRKPFQTDDPDKLLQQIAYKTPSAPHEIDPKIPGVLSRIVMKAMGKRPEKRYQTAEKMALDIKRYLVRARSARNGVQIPVATLDQKEPNVLPDRAFIWIACITLAGVAAAAAVIGLSRLLR
jgi:serine/threonine protein kinase